MNIVIIGASVLGVAFIVVVILGYRFNWSWTGLAPYTPPTNANNFQRGKTLWDWMQLLFIPIVLAVGGFWLNQIQKSREEKTAEQRAKIEREVIEKRAENEREIAFDNQREKALQDYIDKISELLLEKHLHESKLGKLEDEAAKIVARVRTITVLSQLDARRIGYVFAFLRETGLMRNPPNRSIVTLSDADLNGMNFRSADLHDVNLSEALLYKANLSKACLMYANLCDANLCDANLSQAELLGANLSHASLSGASLRGAHLSLTNLSGAYLSEADLSEADLFIANLSKANLSKANLREADLSKANLMGATGITNEELEKEAKSLDGATMPDGTTHP